LIPPREISLGVEEQAGGEAGCADYVRRMTA
jgi:hypothetical protein